MVFARTQVPTVGRGSRRLGIPFSHKVEVDSLCASITLAALELRFAAQAKSIPLRGGHNPTVYACPQRQLVGLTVYGLRLTLYSLPFTPDRRKSPRKKYS